MKDAYDFNAIDYPIYFGKFKMFKFILDMEIIKEALIKEESELGAILKRMGEYFEVAFARYILERLELTETRLKELAGSYFFDAGPFLSLS